MLILITIHAQSVLKCNVMVYGVYVGRGTGIIVWTNLYLMVSRGQPKPFRGHFQFNLP